MYIVKCTLLSNLSQFSKGGGGHWWDGWGCLGIIIKEKLIYITLVQNQFNHVMIKVLKMNSLC